GSQNLAHLLVLVQTTHSIIHTEVGVLSATSAMNCVAGLIVVLAEPVHILLVAEHDAVVHQHRLAIKQSRTRQLDPRVLSVSSFANDSDASVQHLVATRAVEVHKVIVAHKRVHALVLGVHTLALELLYQLFYFL